MLIHDTTYVTITHQCTSIHISNFHELHRTQSLVFFTTDHFILFVHSSRMFYYFVYSHVHVVGSCPAMLAAGRLPVCLLACCQWGYRVIPSYYSAPSYEPLSLSSCVWRVLMLQPLLADSWCLVALIDLLLRRRSYICSMWSKLSLRLLVYSQLAINSSCL